MMDQQTIFPEQYDYVTAINDLLADIIAEKHLPENSLQYNLQEENKNEGDYLLQIFEPDYPDDPNRKEPHGVTSPVLVIQEERTKRYAGALSIKCKSWQFDNVPVPESAYGMTGTDTSELKGIRMDKNDPALLDYIRQHILYRLSIYHSSNSFSCCSKFMQCSDAGMCQMSNLLYSTGCQYRQHLDKGEIFYGKNRNWDYKTRSIITK